jgi:hypothetical protein
MLLLGNEKLLNASEFIDLAQMFSFLFISSNPMLIAIPDGPIILFTYEYGSCL